MPKPSVPTKLTERIGIMEIPEFDEDWVDFDRAEYSLYLQD